MTKPKLDTSTIALDVNSIALAQIWQQTINEIDKLSAWPASKFAPYSIRLVNGSNIQTHWKAAPAAHGFSIRADPEFPMTVDIGLDILKNGVGASLMSASTPVAAVAFHLLSHELFHISEMERMADCSVRFGAHFSGFAVAARPELSSFGVWMLSYLTESYPMIRTQSIHLPPQRKYSPTAWKAADIVSEACADLLALQLMRKTNHNWSALKSALITLRMEQETKAQTTPVDGAGQIGPMDYQIGSALKKLAHLVEQDDPSEIWRACWSLSRNVLIDDPFLDPDAKEKLESSAPMFKPPGLMRRLFQSSTR